MKEEKIDLTLLVPGLLRPELTESAPAPCLARMLSRADAEDCPAGLESLLFALFSIVIPDGQDLPVAPVTRLHDTGEADGGFWLRADPVYCQADRDRVVMITHEGLQLSQQEAQDLAGELNALFADDGWEFQASTPMRWYLRLPEAPAWRTTPLSAVMGRTVYPYLPQGPEVARLHRALTEIEMLLFASRVNQARRAQGLLPVTNLWLWGGGCQPARPETGWADVWSDDALALGLARLAGIPRCSAPADFRAWRAQVVAPGRHLVELPVAEDIAALEKHWFAPLALGLKSREISSLTLWAGGDRLYRLSSGKLRRWWRRARPLKEMA